MLSIHMPWQQLVALGKVSGLLKLQRPHNLMRLMWEVRFSRCGLLHRCKVYCLLHIVCRIPASSRHQIWPHLQPVRKYKDFAADGKSGQAHTIMMTHGVVAPGCSGTAGIAWQLGSLGGGGGCGEPAAECTL